MSRRFVFLWRLGVLSAGVLALAGCGGDGSDPPAESKAQADAYTLDWNAAKTLAVLDNDSHRNGVGQLSVIEAPANGLVTVEGQQLVYTPKPGFFGEDGFRYRLLVQGPDSANKAQSEAAVKLTVEASLTLKGQVIDAPIANATVTATLGAQTIKVTANAQGQYSLPLKSSRPGDFLSLTAVGVGGQTAVVLNSLVGEVGGLAKLAQAGVVAAEQAPGLRVSHYATALAALLKDANGGKAPSSDAHLATLGEGIDGERLLDLATAIKLVVDQGVALPAGVSDTAALVAQPASSPALGAFLKEQSTNQATLYSATRKEVVTGTDVGQGTVFAPSQAQAQLYAVATTAQSAAIQVNYKPDGSAQLITRDGVQEAHWTSGAGHIELILAEPFTSIGYTDFDPKTGEQYTLRYSTLAYRIKQLVGNPDFGTVAVSARATQTLLDGPQAGQTTDLGWEEQYVGMSRNTAKLPTYTAADFAPGTLLAGVLNDTSLIATTGMEVADILEITGSSSAKFQISGKPLTWSVSEGQLVTQNAAGLERHYQLLKEDKSRGLNYLLVTEYANGQLMAALVVKATKPDAKLAFKVDASLFKRWLSGLSSPSNGFYVTVAGDGTGYSYSSRDGIDGAPIPLSWTLGEDATLNLKFSNGRLRHWRLLGQSGDYITVLEWVEDSEGRVFIPYRVNSYQAR